MIGELHVVTGMTATFTYGRTADWDIGTTVAAGNGPFSVSGSSHVGNSTGSSVTITRSGNFGHRLLSQFRFQRWHYANSCTGVYDKVEPVKWAGSGLEDRRLRLQPRSPLRDVELAIRTSRAAGHHREPHVAQWWSRLETSAPILSPLPAHLTGSTLS